MNKIKENIESSTEYIRAEIGSNNPTIGLILGSGLGVLAEKIENPIKISYEQIPGFPVSKVIGHAGNLVIGQLEGKTVLAMQGRFHYYEGHEMSLLALPVRVMKSLGIDTLLVTNAAGGIAPHLDAGELMLITDHINFAWNNPLMGPNIDSIGTRFPDNSQTYDVELIKMARDVANQLNIDLKEGVYQFMTGPCYETPAEIKMSQFLGADAVGMSTFPEALAAAHCGMKTLGISYISNLGAGISEEVLDHAEVLENMSLVQGKFVRLVRHIIRRM